MYKSLNKVRVDYGKGKGYIILHEHTMYHSYCTMGKGYG